MYSWTTVWRPQTPAFTVPYAAVIVDMDEGWQMLSNLIGCEHDAVHVGMPVEVEFHPIHDGDLPTISCVPRASIAKRFSPSITVSAGTDGDLPAQLAGEMQRGGDPRILGVAEARRSRRFDMHGGPRRAQRIGEALGGAHQLADAPASSLTATTIRSPPAQVPASAWRADMIEHLRIDRLRRAAQRQFAQRRQVRFGEEMAERAASPPAGT